ncbi:hypothetical protein LguiB_030995 [Lonicera macranthoides]
MTWSNGYPGLANTLVRVDRAVTNYKWRQMFLEAPLRMLLRIYFDHSPIIMLMNGQDKASFDGLFKDDQGRSWLMGNNGRVRNMKINNAELWSIHKGLLITRDKNWENHIVEMDSKVVMDLIGKNEELEHSIYESYHRGMHGNDGNFGSSMKEIF